jgi:hypothetical protein
MAWTWHSRSTAAGAPGTLFALIEGTAAGAMLAVAAETMLPEVFPRGGWAVDITTSGLPGKPVAEKWKNISVPLVPTDHPPAGGHANP